MVAVADKVILDMVAATFNSDTQQVLCLMCSKGYVDFGVYTSMIIFVIATLL